MLGSYILLVFQSILVETDTTSLKYEVQLYFIKKESREPVMQWLHFSDADMFTKPTPNIELVCDNHNFGKSLKYIPLTFKKDIITVQVENNDNTKNDKA